jgi:hypothetical protein
LGSEIWVKKPYLSGAFALGADDLALLEHAGTDLHGLHHSASAAAVFAAVHVVASLAVAVCAEDGAVVVELDGLAAVDVFEGHLDLSLGGSDLLPLFLAAALAAHAEDVEDVVHAAHASASALDAFEAVLVVELSLLGVAEHFVGRADLFELRLVAALVGVVDQSELSEGLLYVCFGGVFGHTEHVVELLGVDLFVFLFVHWVSRAYSSRLPGILLLRKSRSRRSLPSLVSIINDWS